MLVLFLYCDGGPDHRLTYFSVKLSLISLYLKNDLDFLCACQTVPCQSWRNPAERVMSNLNIGLQCVGLMRQQITDQQEAHVANCNSLSLLRSAAKNYPDVVPAVLDSVELCFLRYSRGLKSMARSSPCFQQLLLYRKVARNVV